MNRILAALLLLFTGVSFAQELPAEPKRLSLWSNHAPTGSDEFSDEDAFITVHLPRHPNGAALVICPGGGYGGLVVGPEGHGIAKWLNGYGITGIVLEYRLPKGRSPVPLLDAQRAIRTSRAHTTEWGINPARLGIIGFSAGGHLASTAGTHFDLGDASATDPVARFSCRPDFMILVYPVITMGAMGHAGSRNNLLGKDPSPELLKLFSNETQITAATPSAFLAHAVDDKVVPPDNSKHFYTAMKSAGLEAKLLELPSGGHGLNGYKGPNWDAWQEQAIAWLASIGMIPSPVSPSQEK